ncbi:hypothetical protein SAMN02745126_05966 [Enhydrobacter aerosaccus]|uniref:Methyltransferase domain-containing protein n=1 Tax=Enhydrobacter aerosaccus TaxID=225324 RepID=A0A1T4TBR0_9HYPH|nr:hypothetical protein [Enhydrobacter aerosaccus]SKA37837.1 hypothetical protein SAMN02745126_05966 [Enhydrobacter aerosaccus]
MAITRHLAELVLAEHKHRKISGEVLLLGRQLVLMTPDEAQALVEKLGLPVLSTAFIDYDKTPHPYPKKLISDASFFSLFSDAVVKACDVSPYEGAEIIFSLSDDVPESLLKRFDFIYNGSVLDNVFDPAACIRNASKMLKPDGSVFNYEGSAHASPAYLKFSPDWFFDYYALNSFADCQTYIVTYSDVHRDPWEVYQFDPFTADGALTMPMRLPPEAMVVALAQNSPEATIDRTPLQNVYRSGEHAPYLTAHERFVTSRRRAVIANLFKGTAPPEVPAPQRQSLWARLMKQPPEIAAPPLPPGHTHLGTLGSPNFLG